MFDQETNEYNNRCFEYKSKMIFDSFKLKECLNVFNAFYNEKSIIKCKENQGSISVRKLVSWVTTDSIRHFSR